MIQKSETKILVVDDQPINIKLLQRKLERSGYQVLVAYNGREAIEVVREELPDLILLDVMMPEMDGFETCAELMADPRTETIPIIFITAKASKEGKLEGLDAGAVDYITKPIDLDETLARVRTQLRLQEMFRENLELQRRLGESRRTSAIGAITQGIAHNLNNLLGVVVGYIDLIKAGYDSPQMVQRSVGLMDAAIGRMVKIIRQLSTIASNEKVQLQNFKLVPLLEATVKRFLKEHDLEGTAEVDIRCELPPDTQIPANQEMFESILGKLLINAWECYENESGREKYVGLHLAKATRKDEEIVEIRVVDHGPGLDPSVADNLFDPFVTTKTSVGRGMGLTVVRHGLKSLGAEASLEKSDSSGTTFLIRYPLRS